jgi:uncharacterized protein (UPF0332 family)
VAKPVAIDPAKLIEAAREQAAHRTGRGRPRPVLLRRAVSSAYYALYHCIGLEGAGTLLPNGTSEQQLWVARAFGHRQIKDCCAWIAGRQGGVTKAVGPLVQSLKQTSFLNVSDAFCDLQEARHRADYDHLAAFAKATVAAHIDDAEKAMSEVTGASPQDREAFFVLVALRTKV